MALKVGAAVALGVAFATAVAGAVQDTPPPQDARLLTVPVTVLDKNNAPVTGLVAKDFTIREDGDARTIVEVAPATGPMSVALLVDTAQPPPDAILQTFDLRTGVATFVRLALADHPESRVALMETGGAAIITVPFTNDVEALTKAAGRLWQNQVSSTVTLEGLTDIGQVIAEQRARRRAIVVLDFDSRDTSQQELERLATVVQKAGAAVWAISIRRLGGYNRRLDSMLDFLTRVTGGLRLTAVSATALESQYRTVARALTSQYLVSYLRPIGAKSVSEVQATATRGSKVLVTRSVQ